ncbi:MAG TPA: M56 family metallopeptidase [Nakamurella sp.]|jgi:Zn-dependent protease with chaperone function
MSPPGDQAATQLGDERLPVALVGVVLVLVGVMLAAPVSIALARARWTRRAPGWSLLLWQAVCLAAGFSVVAGLALLAVEPAGHTLLGAAAGWPISLLQGSLRVPWWRVGCGLAALAITALLLTTLARTAWRTVSRRRLHRQILDLLSRPIPARVPLGTGCPVLVMDHRSAVAYTLPGRRSRLVVSTGLLDLLSPAELSAVVEHERAHLRARHDILIMPFQSWVAALGRVRGVREAGRSVGELTEMLADDVASARSAPGTLAAALTRVALERSGGGPDEGPGSGTCVTDRVRRMNHPRPLPAPARVLIVAAAAALLAIPATVLTLTW